MNLLTKIRTLDHVTKVGCILLVMILFYIVLLFILKPVFIEETIGAHTTVMGDHLMTFTSPAQRNLNLLALFLAIGSGLATWLIIKEQQNNKEDVSKQELEIVKKALSTDEKKMVEEVQKAGEITQDSLRFRLDWSKAKVSAILLQLDRMNLVQRERQGKTYNVFIKKK